jgi:hypothetical protein
MPDPGYGDPSPVLPVPIGPPANIGGFSRTQLIELANRRSERRGISLDLGGEFLIALQVMCLEKRWWWRRRIAPFTLTAGQAQYDLSDSTGWDAADFQQMAKDGLKIYANNIPQSSYLFGRAAFSCPEPVFDTDEQETILALQNQFPRATPQRYFIQQNMIITFDPIPDANYPVSAGYWAVPNWTDDSSTEVIPLLPNYLHAALAKRLEMQIYAFSLGEGTEKYTAAAKEYEDLINMASLYRNFADGERREVRTFDSTDAVQSS